MTKINIGQTNGLKVVRYLSNGYVDNSGALLEYQDSVGTSAFGSSTYSSSTLRTSVINYCTTYLPDALKALVQDTNFMASAGGSSVSVADKYFVLSLNDYAGDPFTTALNNRTYTGQGQQIASLSTEENRKRSVQITTRQVDTTGNYPGVIQTSGAPYYNYNGTSNAQGYCPAFMLPLTAPIRLLADGTYDLVPEDPSLSAQTVSTLAEERSGTVVKASEIVASSANDEVIVKIPETSGEVEYVALVQNYLSQGGLLLRRKTTNLSSQFSAGLGSTYYDGYLPGFLNSEDYYQTQLSPSVKDYILDTELTCAAQGSPSSPTSKHSYKVFILSAAELGIVNGDVPMSEGSAIPYFSGDSRRIVNNDSNSPVNYWTRTPHPSGIWYVTSSGTFNATGGSSYSYSVTPCFVLSPDAYLLANDDGTYSFTEDTGPTVSFSFTVPHGTQPVVRQYTYNYEEHYQTMLEGGVLPALGGDTGPTYSEVLAENTWAQIAQAVADKDPILDVWQIGDTKDEVIAGETLTFAIMGKNMDDLADGSGKAGLTFGMTQLMASTRQMNSSNTNAGSFAGSAMYSWLSGTIYPNLPAELKDAIKAVNKKTSSGGGSSAIRTDAMYLWLFSEIEVFGKTTYSYAGEGTQYPYFATSAERIKRLSNGAGAASYWWERSPYSGNSGPFCAVNPSGSAHVYYYSAASYGVCFGFCI